MQPTKKPPNINESVIVALIGAAATIIAAFLGGLFLLQTTGPSTSKPSPSPTLSPLILASIVVTIALLVIAIGIFIVISSKRRPDKTILYSERISQLTSSLTEASADVDRILQEMTQIVREREAAISTLEKKRTELQIEVDSLEKGPAEAVKLFTQFLEKQDKQSRKRDFLLFGLGALISLLGSILGLLLTGGIHLFGH